jgi:hypothetical protein
VNTDWLGQSLLLVKKDANGNVETEKLMMCLFVPLVKPEEAETEGVGRKIK